MANAWFWMMLACMAVDWIAVIRCKDDLRVVTKPLALVLLIGWFTSLGGWQHPGGPFFGIALLFSLIGDIFLLKRVMAARRYFFQMGLAAFLLAQVAYIISFNRIAAQASSGVLAIVALVAGGSFLNVRGILPSLWLGRKNLLVPCVVYLIALSIMLASALALLVRGTGSLAQVWLIAAGAILFYISDSILARISFCVPFSGSELLVMITYHIGQVLITWGALIGTVAT
jgi:uncharacterized membrane protein YhhN